MVLLVFHGSEIAAVTSEKMQANCEFNRAKESRFGRLCSMQVKRSRVSA